MKIVGRLGAAGCWCLFVACNGVSHRLGGEPDAGATEGGSAGTTAGTSGSTAGTSGSGGASTGGTSAGSSSGGSTPTVSPDTNPLPEDCQVPAWWQDATTRDGALTFEPIEIYEGYVVSPREPLPTDDDSVTLFVHSRNETAISGAIVFGTGDLPDPATDPLNAYFPREKYPPGYPFASWDNLNEAIVWGGYALSLRGGSVEGERVRFTANATEQWRTWCELLAGYPGGQCVPQGDVDGFGGTDCRDVWSCEERCDVDNVRYDCGKFVMCSGIMFGSQEAYCACEGCGCSASTTAALLSFDLHLEDDGELTGAVTTTSNGGETYLLYLTPR